MSSNRDVWDRNHIIVTWIGESSTGVTDTYEVLAKISGMKLGLIKWYAPWRRYVFYPGDNTLYDAACLNEISGVCYDRTKMHKSKK